MMNKVKTIYSKTKIPTRPLGIRIKVKVYPKSWAKWMKM